MAEIKCSFEAVTAEGYVEVGALLHQYIPQVDSHVLDLENKDHCYLLLLFASATQEKSDLTVPDICQVNYYQAEPGQVTFYELANSIFMYFAEHPELAEYLGYLRVNNFITTRGICSMRMTPHIGRWMQEREEEKRREIAAKYMIPEEDLPVLATSQDLSDYLRGIARRMYRASFWLNAITGQDPPKTA